MPIKEENKFAKIARLQFRMSGPLLMWIALTRFVSSAIAALPFFRTMFGATIGVFIPVITSMSSFIVPFISFAFPEPDYLLLQSPEDVVVKNEVGFKSQGDDVYCQVLGKAAIPLVQAPAINGIAPAIYNKIKTALTTPQPIALSPDEKYHLTGFMLSKGLISGKSKFNILGSNLTRTALEFCAAISASLLTAFYGNDEKNSEHGIFVLSATTAINLIFASLFGVYAYASHQKAVALYDKIKTRELEPLVTGNFTAAEQNNTDPTLLAKEELMAIRSKVNIDNMEFEPLPDDIINDEMRGIFQDTKTGWWECIYCFLRSLAPLCCFGPFYNCNYSPIQA